MAGTSGRGPAQARDPMRTAALVVGATFLLVGVLGFIPGITSNYSDMGFAGHVLVDHGSGQDWGRCFRRLPGESDHRWSGALPLRFLVAYHRWFSGHAAEFVHFVVARGNRSFDRGPCPGPTNISSA